VVTESNKSWCYVYNSWPGRNREGP